jgi:hypothetical protein
MSRASEETIYKRLYKAILKHGSARVIVEYKSKSRRRDSSYGGEYGYRKILKNGFSTVSYPGGGRYKKAFQASCFMCEYFERSKTGKLKLTKTLKAMKKHDRSWLRIKEIRVGKGRGKKISLEK